MPDAPAKPAIRREDAEAMLATLQIAGSDLEGLLESLSGRDDMSDLLESGAKLARLARLGVALAETLLREKSGSPPASA